MNMDYSDGAADRLVQHSSGKSEKTINNRWKYINSFASAPPAGNQNHAIREETIESYLYLCINSHPIWPRAHNKYCLVDIHFPVALPRLEPALVSLLKPICFSWIINCFVYRKLIQPFGCGFDEILLHSEILFSFEILLQSHWFRTAATIATRTHYGARILLNEKFLLCLLHCFLANLLAITCFDSLKKKKKNFYAPQSFANWVVAVVPEIVNVPFIRVQTVNNNYRIYMNEMQLNIKYKMLRLRLSSTAYCVSISANVCWQWCPDASHHHRKRNIVA